LAAHILHFHSQDIKMTISLHDDGQAVVTSLSPEKESNNTTTTGQGDNDGLLRDDEQLEQANVPRRKRRRSARNSGTDQDQTGQEDLKDPGRVFESKNH
jgi:hypothetical protein